MIFKNFERGVAGLENAIFMTEKWFQKSTLFFNARTLLPFIPNQKIKNPPIFISHGKGALPAGQYLILMPEGKTDPKGIISGIKYKRCFFLDAGCYIPLRIEICTINYVFRFIELMDIVYSISFYFAYTYVFYITNVYAYSITYSEMW